MNATLRIRKKGALYTASVRYPFGGGKRWKSPHPMPADELVVKLRELGFHDISIGEAFDRVDPEWAKRSR